MLTDLTPAVHKWIESLDGTLDLTQVLAHAQAAGLDESGARSVLDALMAQGILEDAALPPTALQGLAMADLDRLRPDLDALDLARDTPVNALTTLGRRRGTRVRVYGAGRVGAQLVNLLASAGIGDIRVIDSGPTRPEDLVPGGLTWSEIGLPRDEAAATAAGRLFAPAPPTPLAPSASLTSAAPSAPSASSASSAFTAAQARSASASPTAAQSSSATLRAAASIPPLVSPTSSPCDPISPVGTPTPPGSAPRSPSAVRETAAGVQPGRVPASPAPAGHSTSASPHTVGSPSEITTSTPHEPSPQPTSASVAPPTSTHSARNVPKRANTTRTSATARITPPPAAGPDTTPTPSRESPDSSPLQAPAAPDSSATQTPGTAVPRPSGPIPRVPGPARSGDLRRGGLGPAGGESKHGEPRTGAEERTPREARQGAGDAAQSQARSEDQDAARREAGRGSRDAVHDEARQADEDGRRSRPRPGDETRGEARAGDADAAKSEAGARRGGVPQQARSRAGANSGRGRDSGRSVAEEPRAPEPFVRVRAGGPYLGDRTERPDLVILAPVGPLDGVLVNELTALGIPHLLVAAFEGHGSIGPLVEPGVTACLHCLDLTRRDRDPGWPIVTARLGGFPAGEIACDTALAALVAAEAAAHALAYLDGRACVVTNGTIDILPDWQRKRRTWTIHSQCRCIRNFANSLRMVTVARPRPTGTESTTKGGSGASPRRRARE
jgi:hypothetical protein